MIDQAKKDLAEAYRLMMDSAAWKHFQVNILTQIEVQAIKDEDAVSLDDLTVAKISECRGRRNAIRKISKELYYILEAQSV